MRPECIDRLTGFLGSSPRIAVLTGAGCSTESGIADYRDTDGNWKHRQPVLFNDFVRQEGVRRRYWARSLLGWAHIDAARPNAAHRALAQLEKVQRVTALITQNVDGLHQKAGSGRVIDLHGRLDSVECLDCRARFPRASLQRELARHNPAFLRASARMTPDGDAELDDVDYERFVVSPCAQCGGILKPAVVFFGESVPRSRVELAFDAVSQADALLVVGSSLMVFSGYRFVRFAHRAGMPIAIVNIGRTRADALAGLSIRDNCTHVLPAAVSALVASLATGDRPAAQQGLA
jgi:NAD-dependent SIR2 family protein deacetylase